MRRGGGRRARRGFAAAAFGLLLLAFPVPTDGHEIPTSVMVQTFVVPEDGVLRFLVRAPLDSMRDFEFPLRSPDRLDIPASEPLLFESARMWIRDYVTFFENGVPLEGARVVAARLSLPDDASFTSYPSALAHVLGDPLPADADLTWDEAFIDVLLEYPITSDSSDFAIRSELAHLGINTTTILRFQLPGQVERLFQFTGDPGYVELDPRWHHAARRFVELGFFHILGGIDHILFVLCLVIPFRRVLPLVAIITSFTVAHSITLAMSALGYAPSGAWFPPAVEILIALSIVYMAFENIVGVNLQRRWLVAFGFGLVHGFGFSFLLRESLQFAGGHLLTSLFAFNLGVELGQIFVLVLVLPLLALFFRYVSERMGVILLSALVAHTAWHWMGERWAELGAVGVQWPALDLALLTTSLSWLAAILMLSAIAWGMFGIFGRIEGLKRFGGSGARS